MNLSSTSQFVPQVTPDVAIFLRSLYGGGAERAMLNLAHSMIDQGLKVDLLLARVEGQYLSHVRPEVRIVDLKARQVAKSLFTLMSYLKQVQPRTLLVTLHYPCEIALLAKQLTGVPTRIIISEQNTLSVEAKLTPKLSARLSPLAARFFYPWADGITAVSKGVADDLARVTRLQRERIQIIYNPVVSDQMLLQAQEPVEHPWFTPGNPPVILAVGRLYLQKDYPTLLRAFAKVRQVKSVRLMILGDGPERENLTKLTQELDIAEDVALPGFAQNPHAYMTKAAVFVLSSAWEGLPTVLIEALAVGTPVVSTNCESGPSEILAQGKYGHLTPVGDSQAIAQAILQVLNSGGQKVDPHWLEQYTPEVCAQKYVNIMGIS